MLIRRWKAVRQVNVVYNCHIPEVMGYAERGYCFRRGDDALFLWDGYFSDLMSGMWRVYGYEFDPDEPSHPHLDLVPMLREWNEQGTIGAHGPLLIAELPATARAFRDTVAELRRAGAKLADSPQHGEALAAFLERAAGACLMVTVEERWGSHDAERGATADGGV
jgi:hypothetical protein